MSFDRIAPHYRWMEKILAGEKLQRCRTAFLDEIPKPENILLLGEGHGRCLVEICQRFPDARITCMDASRKMLEQSRQRLRRCQLDSTQVQFIHADVLHWKPEEGSHDLVITNFFLDCFPADPLQQIILKIVRATTADANWLIADFQIASRGLRRIRSLLILALMYSFFRAVTRLPARKLIAPDLFLERAGFGLHRRIERDWGLLHSSWWTRKEKQFRNDCHSLGRSASTR